MKIELYKNRLNFLKPATTSRGQLKYKDVYYGIFKKKEQVAFAEFPLFPGLSFDDDPSWENEWKKLSLLASEKELKEAFATAKMLPSIQFGLEQALYQLQYDFPTFDGKIPINGLVWMNPIDVMLKEAEKKVKSGFSCIKLKIGALPWEDEIAMLSSLRNKNPNVEIRLDANGAFDVKDCLQKLHQLATYNIHSIEQPIRAKQWTELKEIIDKSPIPIALDEELIPLIEYTEIKACIDYLMPHYLVLKPGLLGGFKRCEDWIELAEENQIEYWFTSSLESNLGLEYLYKRIGKRNTNTTQGLGTGGLFETNFPTSLKQEGNQLFVDKTQIPIANRIKWIEENGEKC